MNVGGHSMVAPLRRVVVKRPFDAFPGASRWDDLGWLGAPDADASASEHAALVELLRSAGADVLHLPPDDATTADSIYTHDPALVTDAGVVVFGMGKAARRGEGRAMERALRAWDVPVLGSIGPPAAVEGGDLCWLDDRTLLAGRGFRTTAAGITALRALVAPLGVAVEAFDLPYASGPGDVLHLLSVISPVDVDLAVVHRPLMPVALFELLRSRGVEMVDVAPDEYATLGCNVLALAPRDVVVADGNPVTAAALEVRGVKVRRLRLDEIGVKGSGGPTCLTRPLVRG